MKTIIKFLTVVLFTVLIQSCFKDDSLQDINKFEGVEIDTTGMSALSVYQFEHLTVEPDLRYQGITDERFSYEWKINLAPNDTLYEVLSNQRNLDSEIDFKPTDHDYPLQVVYTVTDEKTGINYIMSWPLRILNNIGEGIIVAETADGSSTDLSHIMSSEVTPGYESISVKHHVFSSINDNTIPGITKQLKYYSIYGKNAVLGITDEGIYRINPLDFTIDGTNGDLFYVAPDVFQPQKLDQVLQGSLLVNNGNLTSTYFGASKKYGVPFSADYDVPAIFAANPASYPAVTLSFFDEAEGRFIYQPSLTQFGDTKMHETPASEDGPFDPSKLQGMTNLAAGVGTSGNFRHVLENTTTGEIGLYILDGGEMIYPDLTPPAPLAFYDLSQAPGIADAQFFTFLDNQRILYYGTSTKIYAVLFSTSNIQVEERYTVPTGQEITTLQVYQQADYPFRSTDDYLPLNDKALLMSTFDGNQGRVYLMPLINTGVGNIDEDSISVFEGFDRITALGTQL